MRKIYLDNLNKKGKIIDWMNSIGIACQFIYDDISGELLINDVVRVDGKTIIRVEYKEEIFDIGSSSLKSCSIKEILGLKTRKYHYDKGDVFGDIVLTCRTRKERKGRTEKAYGYRCYKCGYEGCLFETQVKTGVGCQVCHNRIVARGINDIATTSPDMVKYLQNPEDAFLYTKSANRKIPMKCPDCGFKKVVNINVFSRNGFSCKKCGDGISYPNKLMFSILRQLDVDFKVEYSPDWAKGKRYDFYIPLENVIVEMDGALGHGNKIHPKSKITEEESIMIDMFKDEMANRHGIKVVRIDCLISDIEYIKERVYSSELNDVFDLTCINWEVCHGYAISSRVKEICDLWNTNAFKTTKDISEFTKIHQSTIVSCLNKGAKAGICNYNPRIEKSKSSSINGKKSIKKVEVFKDDSSVGIFDSLTQLSMVSMDIFNINLSRKSVSDVCSGKRESYKGFTFKYIV